jgi:alkanesulfonate monooxygenase SsuD/methylene tetrahydromethanopterin reductase-like flavin-dependent oxidoreductase (luciferase family)
VQDAPDEVARKYAVLARHCAEVGRDFSSITKTSTGYCILADSDDEARARIPPWAGMVFPGDLAGYGLIGTVETIHERLATWERAGVDELVVGFQDVTDLQVIRRFAAEFVGPDGAYSNSGRMNVRS